MSRLQKNYFHHGSDEDQNHSVEVKDLLYILNWSHVIETINGNGDCQEMLTDLDNIAVRQYLICFNIARSAGKSLRPFLYLEEFMVDVENMLVYKYGSSFKRTIFRLVCTERNDRRRAQRTQRRDTDMRLVTDHIDDKFAKENGEYGKLWKED